MTNPEGEPVELVVERWFEASRARVWRAWTQSDLLARWFHPAGCAMENAHFEVRPGGSYSCDFRMADNALYRCRGRFLTLDEPFRIVMTHGWADAEGFVERETRVTVDLAEEGDRTLVRVRQVGLAEGARASHRQGWFEGLSNLERVLAALV